jgi:hypothetical protein
MRANLLKYHRKSISAAEMKYYQHLVESEHSLTLVLIPDNFESQREQKKRAFFVQIKMFDFALKNRDDV